ncbi:MAG: DUF3592 domain-containing protein [Novosphingobium sp.]
MLFVAIAFVGLVLALMLRSDLPRWRSRSQTTLGEVIGHRSSYHDNARSFAAIYRFAAEGAEHEVIDQVYSARPQPPVGTLVQLSYPEGRPDLARVSRPVLWLFVYAVLLFGLAILIARTAGWLGSGGPN